MGDGQSGPRTLQELPRFERGWTFLWVEHARIEREEHGIAIMDTRGIVPVPAAVLSVLMLGPGTAVTHGAMEVLAENGCSVVWAGEAGVRFYAAGHPETDRSTNLLHQATAWADEATRLEVVRRFYTMRFAERPDDALTLQQVRGMEGVRVREAYAEASKRSGVPWKGRSYDKGNWHSADPVNRALSTANACLYGVVHAAIVSTGFSPAIGFVHTGKRLAFVYDVADIYKVDLTVPLAFEMVQAGATELESRVRKACRAAFFRHRLLARVVRDIQRALGLKEDQARIIVHGDPIDQGLGLWDPDQGLLSAGRNWATGTELPQ